MTICDAVFDKPLEWTPPDLRRDLEALARALDEVPKPARIIVSEVWRDSWKVLHGTDKLPDGYVWSEPIPVPE